MLATSHHCDKVYEALCVLDPSFLSASPLPCLPDGFLLPHNLSCFSAYILVASFKNVLCTWETPNHFITFNIVHCYPHHHNWSLLSAQYVPGTVQHAGDDLIHLTLSVIL